MAIYFDIDGVVRDLDYAVFGTQPSEWATTVNGHSFIDYVNSNLDLLTTAPPTNLSSTIRDFYSTYSNASLIFLSTQPSLWRSRTLDWLDRYFGNIAFTVHFVEDTFHKTVFLKEDDWLIDDHPMLVNMDRVISIKKPWTTSAVYLIRSANQLYTFLWVYYLFEKYLEDASSCLQFNFNSKSQDIPRAVQLFLKGLQLFYQQDMLKKKQEWRKGLVDRILRRMD